MEEQKERVTLGVDAETKRRLKAAAAARGISVSVYCRAAIDKELAQDAGEVEVEAQQRKPDSLVANIERLLEESRGTRAEPALEMLAELHRKYPTRPGSTMTAVDYIREGREIRDRQMDAWLNPKKTG
jgi:uncharacterized protein (DUF1778 family)